MGHQRGDAGPAYPDRGDTQLVQRYHRAALPLVGFGLLGFGAGAGAGGVPIGAAGCLIVEIGCRAALLVGVLVVGSIDVSGAAGVIAVSNAHGTVTGAAGGVLLRPFARLISKDGDSVTTYGEPWDMK